MREFTPSSNNDALVRYTCEPLKSSVAGKSSVAAPDPEYRATRRPAGEMTWISPTWLAAT